MATDTEGQQPTPHTITPHAEAGLDPHIKARDKFTLLPLRDYDGPIDDHDLDFSEPPVALSAEIPTLRPSGKIGNNTEIHARRTEALLKGSSAINKAFLVNAQKASRRLHSSVFPRELDLLTRTLTSLQQFAIVGAPNYGHRVPLHPASKPKPNLNQPHEQHSIAPVAAGISKQTTDRVASSTEIEPSTKPGAIFDHSSKAAQNRLGLNPSITPSPVYNFRPVTTTHPSILPTSRLPSQNSHLNINQIPSPNLDHSRRAYLSSASRQTYQARRFRNAHRDYYWDSDDSDSSSDDESSNARQENISRYSPDSDNSNSGSDTNSWHDRQDNHDNSDDYHDAESADYGHDYHDDIDASHDHSEVDNSEASSDAESTSDRHDSHDDSYHDNSSDYNTGSTSESDNQSGSDSSENEY
ncbi:hypothetical protein B0H12DRAFT_1076842 [Mycena haematopus]|nr:hypothetical protein B0H12DRAFT_1076842 [Mycena haematopus]